MGTHPETSTLKTLADAVTETAAAEEATEGTVGSEGLNVNAAFDGGGAVMATETVVRSETEVVGPGGPDSDSGKPKGNGASLSFEGEGAKKCGHSNSGESDLEQRSSLDKKVLGGGDGDGDVNVSLSSETQMSDNYDEGKRKTEDLYDDERGCTMEMDEGNEEDTYEVEYMEDHRYSVGDLVWGKIKSHPWWPGQIYDPSHASESAMKYNQKDRLLVAYFGDGSFAWCLPSQLIPFAQYFEDMSKQSTSKTFVNAVQEAVDEIGRLVELEMTCPCIPEKHRNARPQAVNAGIKAGLLVPDGEIGKLLSFRYDPVELLAAVGNAAESVSFPSMLDFSILKGWLSAFYCERGGYVLPVYYGPLQIEGLEDKDRNEAEDANDFSVPIEVPIHRPLEEDSFSSEAFGPANGQVPQEDKNHHRRKQKSVAELMAEGSSSGKHVVRKRISHGEVTNASNFVAKKQKLIVEVENHIGSSVAAPGRKRGRKKKDDNSQSGESAAPDLLNGFQTEEEMQESKLEKERITIPDANDGEGVKGGPEEISSPRERKKSKYLSPPYTTPTPHVVKAGNLISKKEELESEEPSERKTNRARMGERMTKAAGKVLESSSGMKNCDENDNTVEKKLLKGKTGVDESSDSSTGQKKAIGAIDVNCSVDQLLSGVQSFAVNTGCSRNSGSLDLISGFFLAFRKSMYAEEEESCKDDNKKKRLGVKRKSLNSEPEKLVKDPGRKLPVAGKGDKKTSSSMQEKSDAVGGTTPKEKTGSKSGSIREKSNKPKNAGAGKKEEYKEADEKSCPDNANSGVCEISDLDSARETLRNMTSMLEKCDDRRISTEAISKLNGDIKLLFEKIKKTVEAAAN